MADEERMPSRVKYRVTKLAVQWLQEEHPQKWAAIVRQAWSDYTPRPLAGGCPHDKVIASAIMRKCAQCGEFLGAWAVENEANREFLQEILEAEGGAG